MRPGWIVRPFHCRGSMPRLSFSDVDSVRTDGGVTYVVAADCDPAVVVGSLFGAVQHSGVRVVVLLTWSGKIELLSPRSLYPEHRID